MEPTRRRPTSMALEVLQEQVAHCILLRFGHDANGPAGQIAARELVVELHTRDRGENQADPKILHGFAGKARNDDPFESNSSWHITPNTARPEQIGSEH